MKKAFYDMLCGEVESGNMLPIFDLLKDIQQEEENDKKKLDASDAPKKKKKKKKNK